MTQKGSRKKVNLNKLYKYMNSHAKDAVDTEVVKRFRMLADVAEEDITKISVDNLLDSPSSVNLKDFPEQFQPYVRHYIFMEKRDAKEEKNTEKVIKKATRKKVKKAVKTEKKVKKLAEVDE